MASTPQSLTRSALQRRRRRAEAIGRLDGLPPFARDRRELEHQAREATTATLKAELRLIRKVGPAAAEALAPVPVARVFAPRRRRKPA
ncbi:MAG: hypothetical protein P4L82_12080 [Ancalomicrobiaceae bacterium]|nr:hypothetical protein [Ancalomicrobiaceae bacterium]